MLRKPLTLSLGLIVIFLSTPRATAQADDATEKVKQLKDLEFATAGEHSLKLDLYLPISEKPAPLVVWIHGGGWRAGSKSKPPLRRLTSCGYAVASVSYRFTDKAIFPAQIHDCKAAIRWLRGNAEKYGYDADWIAVAGSSAGGHLALLTGVTAESDGLEGQLGDYLKESTQVQAIVDYFGPSDFPLRGKSQPELAYSEKAGSFALLGGLQSGRVDPKLERVASPAAYVSAKSPPLLIFHGTEDKRVLIDQSERMVELYGKFEGDVELVRVEGAGHGGAKFFVDQNFDRVVAFLNEHRRSR